MTERNSGDAWVCQDCYFAHHCGIVATIHGTDHLAEQPIPLDEVESYRADGWTIRFYAGESDTPCDREPLAKLAGLDLSDNTCSDHYYDQDPQPTDTHDVYDVPCEQCGNNGDENGIHEFSWSSCEGCGSTLGGSRHRLHWEET